MNLIKNLKSKLGLDDADARRHLVKSDVFCMAPWVQLHAQTNGLVAPCCMSSVDGKNQIGDLNENADLRDAWNSPAMKQLRTNMCKGEKSSICNNCYKYEELGKQSERMQYNRDFKHYYGRVRSMLGDGTVLENKIPVIDIRFSNKCNYKCRICNSSFSTLWYDEEQKLGKAGYGLPKEIKVAANQQVFWEGFKSLMPYVERLHFAGGEPLFMDEHYEVLEHLVAIGNTDVNLTYNTNFSTLRYKKNYVIDLWKKFRKVDIWASLDGMGQQGDYHRKGQKWKEVEENIRTLQSQCPNAIFGVNVTVSIFNILHIPAFYQYMVENKLVDVDRMNLYLLFWPEHFCITNLPVSVKEKALKQFTEMKSGYLTTLTNPKRITEHIDAVVNLMLSKNDKKQAEFRKAINEVDSLRNENFIDTFPELAELMKQEGT